MTDRAITHFRRNEWTDAKRLAQAVVESKATSRETCACHQLLGLIAHRTGNYSEAIEHFQQAVTLQPHIIELRQGLSDAHTARARQLRRLSQREEAERHVREALRWQPESPDSLNVLGVLLHEQNQLNQARQCFEQGIRSSPRHAQLRVNFANLLAALQEKEAAIEQYRIALELRPDDVRTILNTAGVMLEMNRHTGAFQLLQQAVTLSPANADVHFNLGNAHSKLFQIDKAIYHYEQAVRLKPSWCAARAHWMRQRTEICDWRDDWDHQMQTIFNDLPTEANVRDSTQLNVSQMPALPIPRHLMRAAACRQTTRARELATQLSSVGGKSCPIPSSVGWALLPVTSSSATEVTNLLLPEAPRSTPNETNSINSSFTHIPVLNQRLKIGYLSQDLRHHAIGHLTCGLFEHHDRNRFEVFTYSFGTDDGSEYRRRIVAGSEHFHDLFGWSDSQIVNRIVEDQVDVLIDVQGYSAGARPLVLVARPAPVLIHYLGFPGTLGGLVDYFITDPVLTPPGSPLRDEFEESLIYLPDTYQISDDQPTVSSQPVTREQCRLPPDGFVFCAFNNNYKIQPQIFDVWMRILRNVPKSVLWLLSMQPAVVDNLRREAERRGVDPERLIFADVVSKPEHLARLNLADLFLDTTVCGAHTTATDSLWAGVPVLTCPGARFTERVAASLLTVAGLEELIVANLTDYERLAVSLASNPDRCRDIRNDWASRRATSHVFATARRVRHLEQAYSIVWKRHCDGLTPTDVFID